MDPVSDMDEWLHSDEGITSTEDLSSDSLNGNLYNKSFNPNISANLNTWNLTEEDELNFTRDENYQITSTPNPTPPPSPQPWLNLEDVIDVSYKNCEKDFYTPTRPSDPFHAQQTMHDAEALTSCTDNQIHAQVIYVRPFLSEK